MITIGLTGGIATGKTTVSTMFRYHGAAIFNADEAVHQLMEKPDIINTIQNLVPQAVSQQKVNRKLLGVFAFHNNEIMTHLEGLFHPKVEAMEARYKIQMKRMGKRLLICDIPLLFESHSEHRFDVVVTVTCPPHLQRARALARPSMTEEKLTAILARQMPQHQKTALSDATISTGLGKAATMQDIKTLLHPLKLLRTQ